MNAILMKWHGDWTMDWINRICTCPLLDFVLQEWQRFLYIHAWKITAGCVTIATSELTVNFFVDRQSSGAQYWLLSGRGKNVTVFT